MPISRIDIRSGKPAEYRRAILDSLYCALQEALNVPDEDEFMVITEHDAANFRYGNYLGVERSEDLVYIEVTVFNTRTVEQKKALYKSVVKHLGEGPGIRPQDVFITVLEAAKENWSLGNGEAQFI